MIKCYNKAMETYESREDYLEAILIIIKRQGYCRSIDVSIELGYSKPSVSIAMKKLKDNGYILIDEKNHITLTDIGEEIAKRIYDRHLTLTKYLMSIGVSEETAKTDACKIEHDLSEESYNVIKKLIK